MADKKDTAEIMSNIAVLLTVCETIKEDVKEIKAGMGEHNSRIRTLEIGQEGLRTELLAVCETIKEDVKEIKVGMGQHNSRIRTLEIEQEGLRTELRAEIRNKGAISAIVAVVAGFVSGYFGIGK